MTDFSSRVPQQTLLGNLYPYLRALGEASTFTHSFLQPRFTDVEAWKTETRALLKSAIPEQVTDTPFDADIVERVDCGDYIREKLYFNSTPITRVPAYLLLPKHVSGPIPGLVCFHDHGGMYYWGKEKIVATENEHPSLRAFKASTYSGRSYATDFCRAGYAVIVIDAFYWGERRFISDEDLTQGVNDWSQEESTEAVHHANHQSGQQEDNVARALYQLGHTWQGLWLRDEIRSLDYLLTRPEVDPDRIGCVGLSIGGFRSAQFAGLEPRVKCAVVVGWMTTYGAMFSYRPQNTHYLQYITGAYTHVDLPDLVSLLCPNALMVIHGHQDTLFTAKGVADAYEKIQAVYDKAGVSDHARLLYSDTPHEFNAEMQTEALTWLNTWLK